MTSSDLRNTVNEPAQPLVNANVGNTDSPESATHHNDAAALAVAATTPGELLRSAREKAGLSMGDIATRLRMAVRQIDALEKSDYAILPAGTFLRGFVRNYAKSVQVDPVQAIALLEKSHGIAAVAKSIPIVVPSQDIKINIGSNEPASPKLRIAILAGILVLLGAAVWYWWEFVRPNLGDGGRAKPATEAVPAAVAVSDAVTPPPVQPTITTMPGVLQDAAAVKEEGAVFNAATNNTPNPSIGAPSEPILPVTASTAPTSSTKPGVVASTTTVPTTLVVALPLVPTVSPDALTTKATKATKDAKDARDAKVGKGGSMLGFTFSGESWVEVVDGTGKTILSRRYKAGEADEVSGRAPFSIVVGKAGATRMAYNGKEFDLTPHTKLSVARVTVK